MTEVESIKRQQQCTWRTLGVDIVSAAYAAAVVSPLIAVVDKFVYNKASNGMSMRASVRSWFSRPKKPFASLFLLPFLVYFATYATANVFDSIHAANNFLDYDTVSASPSKLFATTAVNTALSVFKDGSSAQIAGKIPAPPITYAMFLARDAVTVFASCALPTMIAPKLAEWEMLAFRRASGQDISWLQITQLASPVAAQVVSTPMHILGLDLHQKQWRVPLRDRMRSVWKHNSFVLPLRMMRVVPSFGFGSTLNTSCRTWMFA